MLSFAATVRLALANLLVHKGRSALTSLGIIIGIAGVVATVAAGSGAHRKLDDRLDSAGKNLVIVRPGARSGMGMISDISPLTLADVEAMRKEAGPWLVGVVPWQVAAVRAATATHSTATTAVGTWPEFDRVCGWRLTSGRMLDAADLRKASPVCLLGQTVRRRLFPHTPNPVGQKVLLGAFAVHVVGVLEPKGATPLGIDQDDQVFLPLTTLQRKVAGREAIAMVLASAHSADEVEPAKEALVRTLRRQHRLAPGAGDDFDVSSVTELAAFAVTVTSTLQDLVVVIASVSLLVGGIGIMNIMLVSVTERTREIGIRMAIGATPAAILRQFLAEAVLLSLAGGLAGVLVGVGAAVALAQLADWPVSISPEVVLTALLVTAAVGILFGYYPAWKASRLDPIAALNRE